ncbi:histidinol-phosphate transaminase [Paenibacillus sp. Marseille-P2973]|uniref:histidinol-phosphate transaminase n=1 Tax=Paenibacillus sp. Marseille-P2973 TaxID=1871032 RepID=UPI001B386C6C|nr:histidinol-phosphate transaminase [Paenibacillus sp. Marseille-P2973]MBQ4898463.1 histidinol-phosphate transaminase [Paenibacillus sp. Marseille-P2973]
MLPKPQIVNLPVYQPGKPIEEVKRELGLEEVIKLASNENPYGCSPKARAAIETELSNLSLYPDGSAAELTEVLAGHHGVNRDQIIFGCGSDEIIALITRAFFLPGDETIMADSTFSVYKSNADIEGAVSIEVPLQNGTHDLQAMLGEIGEKTKAVWICNPNNPTGTIVSNAELISFLDQVPANVLVVLDEAYAEYVTDPDYSNGIKLLSQYPNLIVLRTFSKIYGLASLRIGYGVGQPNVIKLINQVREPFNTSRIGQVAAKASVTDHAFVSECREKNREGIEYLYKQFDRMQLSYFPAHGNFIMVDVKSPAVEMFQSLLKLGIIVRSGFGKYPNHIRVTVGSAEQNAKFIAALEQVLSGQGARV